MANIDYSIKDIEKIVKLDGQVKNVEVTRLTAPGENYLSLVLRVNLEVEKNNQTKIISTVAKRLPLNQKKDQEFNFNGHAMKNEINWYTEIVPLLKKFAEEYELGLDFYPEFFGSRLSLDASAHEADQDSVLLLENLIPQGYQNDDRYTGSDLITSKAILKKLALFHAFPIAIKIKNPELFKIIENFLAKCKPNLPTNPDGSKKNPFEPPPGLKSPEEALFEAIMNLPELDSYISHIKPLMDRPKGPQLFHKLTKEPWNTIVHNDFWVNNVMVNHRDKEEEREPLVKIVDFQMLSYGSFAKDLVFYLLSSVRNDVAKESMDELLRYYYEEFISILNKIDVNLELTYEEFLDEVQKSAAESEVAHALFFSTIIFGEKNSSFDPAVEEFKPFEHLHEMIKKMNQFQKDKIVLIVTESVKRNWL